MLLDIDLEILGQKPVLYEQYAKHIRDEYAWVENAAYTLGRTEVLRGFLNRHFIYHTMPYRMRYESQARDNMHAELTALAE